MPELPEVETIVRTLAPQVEGAQITAVRLLLPRTLVFGGENLSVILGGKILRVWRRAKLLLVDLEGAGGKPLHLAFHLKMTGRLFVHAPEVQPHAHTRMVFDLQQSRGAAQLFFDDVRTFGYCRIMQKEDFAHWDFWQKLGPEPLQVEEKEFLNRASPARRRKGPAA